ncbi:MAG TPA: recombinase family protein [Candidatus Methylomirabilis sp.]|nr:recombinase family protein [Candidatus Methylomirabilis sp.]
MKPAIYARVSTLKQELEQTIESQLELLREYVKNESLELDEKHVYIDEGYSGTKLERPGLDALRDAAADGEFQKIIIYSPDRLARRYAYQVIVIEELNKCGCEVIFLQKPITNDPEENLLIQMQGIIAEYERTKILERTRRGRLFKARHGNFLNWSTPPYGYRYQPTSGGQPGYAVIHEEEAELVKQIFHWYVEESISTRSIAKRLNLMGIHPRKGGKGWDPSVIRLILTNEVCIGKAYYNRRFAVKPKKPRNSMAYRKYENTSLKSRPKSEWIEIEVPAIIDEGTFRRAKEQLKKNIFLSSRNNTQNQYLLRRFVRCGECGYKMTGILKGKHAYYSCLKGRDLVKTHLETRCTSKSVRQELLDEVVWQKITELLENPELIIEQYKRQKDIVLTGGTQKQIQKLEQQIQSYDKQIQRLIDAYQTEVITLKDLENRKSSIEKKRSQLQEQIRNIKAAEKNKIDYEKIFDNIEAFCDAVKRGIENASFEDRRKIIELLIEEVVLTNGKVEIAHIVPIEKKGNLQLHGRVRGETPQSQGMQAGSPYLTGYMSHKMTRRTAQAEP